MRLLGLLVFLMLLLTVGCDNMSVIIVAFLHGKKKDEWIENCKRLAPSEPEEPRSGVKVVQQIK
jgi:hypothetical protein